MYLPSFHYVDYRSHYITLLIVINLQITFDEQLSDCYYISLKGKTNFKKVLIQKTLYSI